MTSALETRLALASWARVQQASNIVEEPKGSNNGDPFRLYAMRGEQPLSWCARFVRTGLLLVGALSCASLGQLYDMASARLMFRHLLMLGGATVSHDDVAEGDLRFLVGRGGSDPLETSEEAGGIHHVGIVVRVEGQLATVDGNWGDRLALNYSINFRGGDVDDAIYLRFPKAP